MIKDTIKEWSISNSSDPTLPVKLEVIHIDGTINSILAPTARKVIASFERAYEIKI